MKVLLLKPCWPYPISPEESTYNRIWPPLTLAYSAGLLEQDGIDATVLDAHAERLSGPRLAARLRGFDKIFITSSDVDRWLCPNLNLTPVVEAARLAAAHCPEIYLMGQHGTVDPDRMLQLTGATAVIRGEPEFAVRELCVAGQLDTVPGISYRLEGTTVSTAPRPLLPLDRLPIPAWHRLPLARYHYELLGERFMLLETARGCPFRCTFCAKDVMYGPGVRRRPLARVLTEIETAVTRAGVRTLYFYDLEFLLDQRYVESLCEALIARRYPLRWCCQTRVTDVREPLLATMRQAGCRLIHFGVESGAPRVLRQIRKEATVADAERAVRLTRQAGIETLCFFMLGFPGETAEERQATIRFAERLNPTYVSFHVESPHEAVAPQADGTQRVLAFPPGDRSFDRTVKQEVRQALRRFYLRPAFLWCRLQALGRGEWRLLGRQLQFFRRYLAAST